MGAPQNAMRFQKIGGAIPFDLVAGGAQAGRESWAESSAVVTSWNGTLATTSRATFTFTTANTGSSAGRLDVDRLVGIEGWTPERKLSQRPPAKPEA